MSRIIIDKDDYGNPYYFCSYCSQEVENEYDYYCENCEKEFDDADEKKRYYFVNTPKSYKK